MQRQAKSFFRIILLAAVFLLFCWLVYTFLPVDTDWQKGGEISIGVDWKRAFQLAAIKLLDGKSPYEVSSYHNPPWVLIPMLPMALLSPAVGSAILFTLNIFAYLYVLLKLRVNLWLILPYVYFSRMIWNSINGNIEGIVALGFVMTPIVGLFFVLAKPQIGLSVAAFWFVDLWRSKGIKTALLSFLPVLLAFMISFSLFGFWFNRAAPLTDAWWNSSIWPYGIPIGLVLFAFSLWKREIRFAIAAAPFFSPYLAYHSWAIMWLGLITLIPQSKKQERFIEALLKPSKNP